jgi:hypothetical protein
MQRPLRVRAGRQGPRAQRGYTVNARAITALCRCYAGGVRWGDVPVFLVAADTAPGAYKQHCCALETVGLD